MKRLNDFCTILMNMKMKMSAKTVVELDKNLVLIFYIPLNKIKSQKQVFFHEKPNKSSSNN